MDKAQFSNAYVTHYSYLIRMANRYTKDRDDAQDLVQNAVLSAYLHRNDLEQEDQFLPWMQRILYREYLNQYRKAKRRKNLLSINGSSDAFFYNVSRADNLGYWELVKRDIQRYARTIGKKSYQTFQLFADGHSYEDISRALNVAMGTVKSRINYLRQGFKANYSYLFSPPGG